MKKPTAIIAHSFWGRGGAEAAAMWIIEALSQEFDLTVYTRGGFDLHRLNGIAGTSVTTDQVHLISESPRSSLSELLDHSLFVKKARKIGQYYDLRITASGTMDWGSPAVHFLSSIMWHPNLRSQYYAYDTQNKIRRNIRDFVLDRLGPNDFSSSSDDLYIANSEWTLTHSRPFCNGPTLVIHPAVRSHQPQLLTNPVIDGRFLSFGRIAPEKRIEECIKILSKVKSPHFDISLDIVGEIASRSYGDFLKQRAAECGLSIQILPPVFGQSKNALWSSYSLGINCCEVEAFGISTAEMAASGLIVFAPEASGQKEVLDCPFQLFQSPEDAVQKITTVLDDPSLSHSIRASNPKKIANFDPTIFKSAVLNSCLDFSHDRWKSLKRRKTTSISNTPTTDWLIQSASKIANRGPLVLSYHNIIPDRLYDDALHLGVSHRATTFEKHVQLISKTYNITTDIKNAASGDCVFTFDDGYKNNLLGASILTHYNARGVFFLCARSFETGAPLWIDQLLKWFSYAPDGHYLLNEEEDSTHLHDRLSRRSAFNAVLCRLRSANQNEIEVTQTLEAAYSFKSLLINKELEAIRFTPLSENDIANLKQEGHKIGCHSWGHKVLASLGDSALDDDFRRSREFSLKHCNTKVFSYPFGGREDIDARVISTVERNGFDSAVINTRQFGGALNCSEKYIIGRVSLDEPIHYLKLVARIAGF